ncbi:radical SAM protein [uncultured Methanobrevibacter sp.]|uniref:B12-binding domain-containing radical SAM protein n=1 Tax=uncultured Methanobrevibacter sp. TaxID=253161 RepID=UPI0025E5C2C7|nr:radical SAM protein [uncultured Methanobrevibacter sp.]
MNFSDLDMKNIKKVLLVEPDFPIPNKSRNHSNFLPIGLLKIASYFREKEKSIDVKLIRFVEEKDKDYHQSDLDFKKNVSNINAPDLIFVTSIFTYWSKHVINAVLYYKNKYPKAKIIVGGIYASLMPKHCLKNTHCNEIITGPIPEVEECPPAYDLVDVDYQIIHTSRGCTRKCKFCGTYIIEPDWLCKSTIKEEIEENQRRQYEHNKKPLKKIIFYDNNLLANPHIENILDELIELKKEKKITYVESQSGFDGRILMEKPHLADKLKKAGFKNPKIAWDHSVNQAPQIKEQIDLLIDAGFAPKEISIFMIYNYIIPYEKMEEKRQICAEWKVQITDCRYRPLKAEDDRYSPYKREQGPEDYHIHEESGWTDAKVRKFRRNIRRHNICMRHEMEFHSTILERKTNIPKEEAKIYQRMSYDEIVKNHSDIIPDAWNPKEFHPWDQQDYFKVKKNKKNKK